MLAFDSNVRDFFRKKGGWYFKVRPAEDVVEAAWELYKKAQRRAIPREIIDEAIGRIKPNAVYTNCKSTITNVFESVPPSPPNAVARPSPQHTVGELFANWIRSDDFKADIPLCFAVIRDVLVIEVNRPFDKWYDTPANKDTLPYDDYIRLLKSREQSLQVKQQQPNEPKIWLDERLKAVTKLREDLERYSDIQTRKYFGLFKRSMRRRNAEGTTAPRR